MWPPARRTDVLLKGDILLPHPANRLVQLRLGRQHLLLGR
jgi:hypothetical protein